jgi:hypothetical protein
MANENELNPTIKLPLEQFVREVAAEAARATWQECARACPVLELRTKVERLEIRLAALVGLLVGSGALGGIVGAGAIKVFFG